MARRPAFQTVAIIGTGLIGTSIGLALKRRMRNLAVVGWDTKRRNLLAARKRGAVDRAARSLHEAISSAECIVLATPLESVLGNLPKVLEYAPARSFIIDVAGLKAPVMATARRLLQRRPDVLFAGGHPLAGREYAGPQHARADLFERRTFVICIPDRSPQAAATRRKARRFVHALHATPHEMGARLHDQAIAATSALPQLVAACVALAVKDRKPAARLAGPGYQGVTRLATSPFAPWHSPLVLNRRNVQRALAVFEVRVRKARLAIEKSDISALRRLFDAAAAARRTMASR